MQVWMSLPAEQQADWPLLLSLPPNLLLIPAPPFLVITVISLQFMIPPMTGESTLVASVFTDQPGSFGPLVRVTSSRGIPNQTGAFDPTKPNDHPVLEVMSSQDIQWCV